MVLLLHFFFFVRLWSHKWLLCGPYLFNISPSFWASGGLCFVNVGMFVFRYHGLFVLHLGVIDRLCAVIVVISEHFLYFVLLVPNIALSSDSFCRVGFS